MRRNPLVSAVAVALAAAVGPSCSDGTSPDRDRLVIITESLPAAVVGQVYAEGIVADGGDGNYTWQVVAGQLPAGLALSEEDLPDEDAVITGTPDTETTSSFTIRVSSGDGQSATAEFTIDVIADPIETVALPPALRGAEYSVALRVGSSVTSGITWELATGSLPPGLSLSSSRIQGIPTATDTTEITLRLVSDQVTVSRTFELRVVAERTQEYNITPFEVVDVPEAIRPHLDAAIERWEAVLTENLGRVPLGADPDPASSQFCGGFRDDISGTNVDDVLLIVNIGPIDGVGGEEDVLGSAGPCLIRNSNALPVAGHLTLDSENLIVVVGTAQGREWLQDIITHEIGHVLGFGTLWGSASDELVETFPHLDLIVGSGTDDPRYTGEQAVAEWQALSGLSSNVPLEAEGTEGTREGHWRETGSGSEPGFDHELMTGFIERVGQANPLSRVSIASLADLGYTVDLAAADAYSLPSPPSASLLQGTGTGSDGHLLNDLEGLQRVQVVDDVGRSGAILRTIELRGGLR